MDRDFLDEMDSLDYSGNSGTPDDEDDLSGLPEDGLDFGPDIDSDGGYAVDPEPSVDHFVDGKRVRRRISPKGVLLFLLAGGGVTGLFFLIRTLTAVNPFPDIPPRAFRKEVLSGRTVVIRSRKLRTYAPYLYRRHLASGLDLDLLDSGRVIPQERFRLEFEECPLSLQVIIDIRTRDRNTLALARRLLDRLNRAEPRIDGRAVPITRFFHIRSGRRLVPAGHTADPDTCIRALASLPAPSGNTPFLVPLLRRLSSSDRPYQIVYITDREMAGADAPEAVRLFALLKKNDQFSIYRFHIGTAVSKERDMFAYLAANRKDFRRIPDAFGNYSFTDSTDRAAGLFTRQAANTLPLRAVRIVYRPEKPDAPRGYRDLGIRLRLQRRDTDLTRLTTDRFTPGRYRYALPAFLTNHRVEFVRGERVPVGRGEFILRVKDSVPGIQYWAGRAANLLRGEILAVSDGGTFLIGGARESLPDVGGETAGKLAFLTPHPYFKRGWHSLSERGVLSDRPYPFGEPEGDRTDVGLPVFCYYPGKGPLAGGRFSGQRTAVFGRNHNPSAEKAGRLLGLLSGEGWNVRFPAVLRAVSASYEDTDDRVARTAGFEIVSAFEWLAARFGDRPVLAVFDTQGAHPDSWTAAGDAGRYLSALFGTVEKGGGWIIAPALSGVDSPGRPVLLQADTLVFDGRGYRPRDPARYFRPEGLQTFPLPGRDARTRDSGLTGKGDALAAARLLPALALAVTTLPDSPRHEIVAALQDGVSLRRGIGLPLSVRNRGIVSATDMRRYLGYRKAFLARQLILTNLRKDAYSHIDSLLTGSWTTRHNSASGLAVVPGSSGDGFFKTYQFFDRAPLITGRRAGDAFYDAFTPFHLGPAERQELALLYHRGLVFLLCTRNRHRGWILNIDARLASGGKPVVFDAGNRMTILVTGRGEILFADLHRGTLLNVTLRDGTRLHRPGTGIRTDFIHGDAHLLLDRVRGHLWVFSKAQPRVLRLVCRRTGPSDVDVRFDPTLPCHREPLAPGGVRFLADPVLFDSGTVNLILAEKKGKKEAPRYIKIDSDGRFF